MTAYVRDLTSGKKYNLKFYWNPYYTPADEDQCILNVIVAGQTIGTISKSDWMVGTRYYRPFSATFTASSTVNELKLQWSCASPTSGWAMEIWVDDFSVCDAPDDQGGNPGSGGDDGSGSGDPSTPVCGSNLLDDPSMETGTTWGGTAITKRETQVAEPSTSDPKAKSGTHF